MQTKAIHARPDLRDAAGWLTVALPITTAFGPALIDIASCLIGMLFLAHSFLRREFTWLNEWPVRVLMAVWVFTIARVALASPSLIDLGLAASWLRFPLLGAALAYWVLREAIWRERLLMATAAICTFLALDGLLQYVVGFDIIGHPIFLDGSRLTATLGKPRLGVTIAWMFLPAVFGLAHLKYLKLAMFIALVCLVTILLSGDRLAFLFAVAGLGLGLVLLSTSFAHVWKIAGVAAALLVAVVLIRPDVYARQIQSTWQAVRNVGSTHYGVIWDRALVMARANPITGVGFARYRVECPAVRYGPIVEAGPRQLSCGEHPHHLYLEWLVEGGLVALGGFLAALTLIGRQLVAALPVLRHNGIYVGLLLTLALRLMPFSTATSITRSWYSMPLWLVIGWATAMAYEAHATRAATNSRQV